MADRHRDNEISPTALAVSMLIGAMLGFVVWMVTDLFVFLPVFMGAGLPIGLAWGMRNRERDV